MIPKLEPNLSLLALFVQEIKKISFPLLLETEYFVILLGSFFNLKNIYGHQC